MITLVTITLRDGRSYRAATQPVSMPTRLGVPVTEYAFNGVMVGEVDFSEELDPFTLDAVAGLQQATVEIRTTDDLHKLASDWLHLTAATVEIAIITDQTAYYEDRRVLLGAGRLQGLEIGGIGEVSRFTAESLETAPGAAVGDDARDLGNEWPDTLQDVTAADMTSVVGSKHVWVIGRCYGVPAYKVGAVSGNNRLILCGHELADTGSVTIYEDGVSAGARTPANTSNAQGYYAYDDHATDYAAADGAYTWDASRGGVAKATDATTAVLGAAEVLRWLLSQSGIQIDWARQEETLQRLGGWEVGLWVDQEVPALELIRDRLVPILPIVEVSGSGAGLWFALSDPHMREPELCLQAGQQLLGRDGGMSFSDLDAVRNRYTLNYAYDAITRTYAASISLNPDNDALCYLSDQLYGEQAEDALSTACCWDEATAYRILRSRAARLALPRRILAYYVAEDLLPSLRAGQVVTIEDGDRNLPETRAVIVEIQHRPGVGWIRLALIDRTAVTREST